MVNNIDKYFVVAAFVYAGFGLVLGAQMGASGNHTQMPTHTHMMLLGWVFMAIAGILYRIWPGMKLGLLPLIHFGLHQVGALVMVAGLFLLYDGGAEAVLGPVLGVASLLVIAAWAVFFVQFLMNAGRPV